MSARKKGAYKNRLTMIVAALGALVFAGILAVSWLLVDTSVEDNRRAYASMIDAKANDLRQIAASISETVTSLAMDYDMQTWLYSEVGSPVYYYNAIKIQAALNSRTPDFDLYQYDVAVTRPEGDAFVITGTSTEAKAQFLGQLGFSPSAASGSSVARDEASGAVDVVRVVFTRPVASNSMIVIVSVTLPLTETDREYLDFSLYDLSTSTLVAADSGAGVPEALGGDFGEAVLASLSDGTTRAGDITASARVIPFTDQAAVFSCSRGYLPYIIALLVLAALALLMLAIVVFRLSDFLYNPVASAYNQISDGSGEDGEVDEFEAIVENCNRVKELNQELEKAKAERYMMREQQKYRAFIRGVETERLPNDGTSYFAAALFLIEDSAPNPELVFSEIDSRSKRVPHLHFVRMERSHAVCVQKADTSEEASSVLRASLQAMLSDMSGTDDLRVAVTSPVQGYRAVPGAYSKLKTIIGSRYRVKNKLLLDDSDVSSADEERLEYSLQDERMLISMVLDNNRDALRLFDEIVAANRSKNLGPEQTGRLASALAATLMRIFQELRENPSDLLGEEVDWNLAQSGQEPEKAIAYSRSVLEDLIDEKEKRAALESGQLIDKMKTYIKEHFREPIMLVDLSNEFNLTPKYCSSLFKKLSNDSFKNYLNGMRIEEACRILEENPGTKISELSEAVGFTSSNSFIRAFSRHVGTTPGAYAENMAGKKS